MAETNPSHHQAAPSQRPLMVVLLWLALAAGYLAASTTGYRVTAMAIVGLMVGVLLAASGRVMVGAISAAVIVGLCLYFSTSMQFIVYAPALAAFAFMAWFFYRTLRPGSEPLITRVARIEHPDLPPDMASYTRTLTWAWSLCFVLLFTVTLLLAPLVALDTWSRWAHGLGYLLPGSLFLGEYAYRHHRFRDHHHDSLWVLIANIVAVCRDAALSSSMPDAQSDRSR